MESKEAYIEIEVYQTIDHPAPAIGTKKDCFAYNGKEFFSFATAFFRIGNNDLLT